MLRIKNGTTLSHYLQVKGVQHDNRERSARLHPTGAKVATGQVRMFVDLHIEMTSGTWYQHLVSPIIDNAYTIAMQIIDAVDNPGMKEYAGGVGPEQLGIINTKFWFGYQGNRFGDLILVTSWNPSMQAILLKWNWQRENSKTSNSREPYGTPFGLGSLFAI
jgi:hypothetical protein